MAPLMIIGSVPLYNVMAVIVLSFFHPERKAIDKAVWIKTLKGIVTNPIIIGIVVGLIWSACKIPMPAILNKTVTSIGGMSTPMGLMAMGATFDFRKALGRIKPAVTATIMKLIVFVAILTPAASPYCGMLHARKDLVSFKQIHILFLPMLFIALFTYIFVCYHIAGFLF